MRNSPTPLTPREENAFEQLQKVIQGMDGGCQRDAAIKAVAEVGFDEDEAVYLMEQLLSKGYLYAVLGEVMITDH